MIRPLDIPGPPPEDLTEDPLLEHAHRDDLGRPSIRGLPLLSRLGGDLENGTYYGFHPRLRQGVAVKVLRLPEDRRAEFLTNGRELARISTPHVAQVLEVQVEGDLGYIAMPYIPGQTAEMVVMRAIEAKRPGLDVDDALTIIGAALHGLMDVHKRRTAHGAIHPGNLVIPYTAEGRLDAPQSVLTETGLAMLVREMSPVDPTVAPPGRVGYTAPEVLEGNTPSAAGDVFSIGALLFYLLTAHSPFAAESPHKTTLRTLQGAPRRLEYYRADCSFALSQIVSRSLQKEPWQRFGTAEDMLLALAHFVP